MQNLSIPPVLSHKDLSYSRTLGEHLLQFLLTPKGVSRRHNSMIVLPPWEKMGWIFTLPDKSSPPRFVKGWGDCYGGEGGKMRLQLWGWECSSMGSVLTQHAGSQGVHPQYHTDKV